MNLIFRWTLFFERIEGNQTENEHEDKQKEKENEHEERTLCLRLLFEGIQFRSASARGVPHGGIILHHSREDGIGVQGLDFRDGLALRLGGIFDERWANGSDDDDFRTIPNATDHEQHQDQQDD